MSVIMYNRCNNWHKLYPYLSLIKSNIISIHNILLSFKPLVFQTRSADYALSLHTSRRKGKYVRYCISVSFILSTKKKKNTEHLVIFFFHNGLWNAIDQDSEKPIICCTLLASFQGGTMFLYDETDCICVDP